MHKYINDVSGRSMKNLQKSYKWVKQGNFFVSVVVDDLIELNYTKRSCGLHSFCGFYFRQITFKT
jgi:hypothetical protein